MELTMFDRGLPDSVGRKLKEKSQSIAVAESVTSGLLQFAFSLVKDAAKFYHGGITAYNIAQKFRHLDVDALHALNCDCVSEKTACEMAMHVSKLFTSNWGIGITGYASPVPQSGDKMYAWYAASFNNKIVVSGKLESSMAEGPDTQVWYVNEVLKAMEKSM